MAYSVKQTVLNLLANSLFGVEYPIPAESANPAEKTEESAEASAADLEGFWKAVRKECRNQAVLSVTAPAAIEALQKAGESQIAAEWEKAAYQSLAQNLRVFHEHEKIGSLMDAQEIPYVILKGCASASYYPDPYAREMGDVDFLVHKENLNRAKIALEDAGYICTSQAWEEHHHFHYEKNGMHAELHFGLNGVPKGKVGEKLNAILADLIEKAEPSESWDIMLPCEFQHGLVILIHNANHMSSGGMGLRHLCDWAVFVQHMGDWFQDVYEATLKEIGMWEYANVMTAVCTRSIGLPEQNWCSRYPDAFLEAVLNDIYSSGNFGQKREERTSFFFLQDTNESIEDAGMFVRFMKTLTKVTCSHWPIAKKIVILYPIGWVFFSIRYLIYSLIGKRAKIHASASLRAAHQRNELYQQLHLFETENG